MKKKMVKRLLALVLALALCTAWMLPGFAATAPKGEEAEPHSSCVHNWVDRLKEEWNGERGTSAYHMVNAFHRTQCSKCGMWYPKSTWVCTATYPVSHPVPCSICGYY